MRMNSLCSFVCTDFQNPYRKPTETCIFCPRSIYLSRAGLSDQQIRLVTAQVEERTTNQTKSYLERKNTAFLQSPGSTYLSSQWINFSERCGACLEVAKN